jgi:hypothetical protein
MEMKTENKLYVAVGVLVVLGGSYFFLNKKEKAEAAQYTLSSRAAELPKLAVSEEDTKKIDKIQITKAGSDGGAPVEVELVKSGEDWKLSKPVDALTNQANVKSLLDNLKSLKSSEMIDPAPASYEKFGVSDDKALHAVFHKGNEVALDVYFGESGGRGQMTRLAGKPGVFAVKGYSSYLYSRDVKGWRDLTIFKFEDTAVTHASITNEHGAFTFEKEGETWKGKFAKPKGQAAAIKDFDESKVKDMIRAYKSLNADGFAEGKTEADVGLDSPKATISFTLKDGAKRDIKIGTNAEGSSRWVKASTGDEIWSIGSWAADWAVAELKKFQKEKSDKKDDKADAPPNPHGGMGMGTDMDADPHGH